MDPLTIGLGIASLGGQLFGAMKGGQANNANDALLAQRKEENDAFLSQESTGTFFRPMRPKEYLKKSGSNTKVRTILLKAKQPLPVQLLSKLLQRKQPTIKC
jgi:hypothetical protein